jgi:hypothetical protein
MRSVCAGILGIALLAGVATPAPAQGRPAGAAIARMARRALRRARTNRAMAYIPLIQANQWLPGSLTEDDPKTDSGWVVDPWSYQGRRNELVSFTLRADYKVILVALLQNGDNLTEIGESKEGAGSVTLEINLPKDGDYLIYIVGTQADSRGPYTLTTKSSGSVTDVDYARLYPGGGDPNGRYALLVAADDYPGEDNDLHGGPHNDVQLMRSLLIDKYGFRPEDILILRDVEANREQIIQAFRRHLGQAGPHGVAVFHYSGHGMQLPDNRGWTGADDPEPDGKDEAIATWGTQGDLYGYILDDEMAVLTSELRAGSTLIVLDMCHAGTGTRGAAVREDQMRSWASVAGGLAVPRGLSIARGPELPQARFIAYRDVKAQVQTPSRSLTTGHAPTNAEYEQPVNHILIAGSTAEETSANYSLEMKEGGHANVGLLTFMVFRALMTGSPTMSFTDLLQAIQGETNRASIEFRQAPQHPQVEGARAGESVAAFLGAAR